MRELIWTNEPPNVGQRYYWIRDTRYKEEAGIVFIGNQQAEKIRSKGLLEFTEYAGPIDEPLEGK